jgi:hypothetical protein
MEEARFLATSPVHAFYSSMLKVSDMRSTGWCWRKVSLFVCWRKYMANNDWLSKVATLVNCNSCKVAKSVEEKRSSEIAEINIATIVIAEIF